MYLLFFAACALFIQPEEGDYDVEASDMDASTSCNEQWELGIDDSDEDVGTIELEISDDEIEFVDWFECERAGLSFECELSGREEVDGYDAVVSSELTLDGAFTSATTFEADFLFEVSCSGDDCDGLDDCEFEAVWTGELDN